MGVHHLAAIIGHVQDTAAPSVPVVISQLHNTSNQPGFPPETTLAALEIFNTETSSGVGNTEMGIV